MNKQKLLIGFLLLVAVSSGFLLYPRVEQYFYRQQMEKENIETLHKITSKDVVTKTVSESIQASVLKPVIPEKAYLEVPFFCQAPMTNDASWDIHHASCEEAAVLQAVYYDTGVKQADLAIVDKTLQDMIAWQEKHFGVHKDIHADTIKMLMVGFFGYEPDEIMIMRNASIYDIKQQIASGFPVIAPTYGRMLKNPFYKQPGPEYHMVTVIGYTEDRIITNDVGTKRGKDFSYPLEIFKASMDREGADALVIRPKRTLQKQ
ncbi:C39 family peptidase [bacterium]|nr:C39 family peptidase [bacterium]